MHVLFEPCSIQVYSAYVWLCWWREVVIFFPQGSDLIHGFSLACFYSFFPICTCCIASIQVHPALVVVLGRISYKDCPWNLSGLVNSHKVNICFVLWQPSLLFHSYLTDSWVCEFDLSLLLSLDDGYTGLLNKRRWMFVLFCGNPLLFHI